MNFLRSYILLLLLAALSAAPARAAGPRSIVLIHDGKLWSADAAGGVRALPFEIAAGEEGGSAAPPGPVLSPDGRYVAFTRDNDLWLHDLRTEESYRATRDGHAADDAFAAITVTAIGWSADARTVLYHVDHSDPVDPEDPSVEKEIRTAPYGYRLFDVEKRTNRPVTLAGEFKAWLPDGRFLLTSEENDLLNQFLLVQKPDSDLPERLIHERGQWGRVDVDREGRWLVASLGQPLPLKPGQMADEAELSSRIVKIDLRDGTMTDVTKSGGWSEFQRPRFSPNGRRISWLRQDEPDAAGFTRAAIVVDGKTLSAFPMPVSYEWIDDAAIAVSHADGLDVISVDDGRRLGGAKTAPPTHGESVP